MVSKLDDQVGRVIKPAERADTPHSILVKTYTGKQGEATALFQADCIEMATQAYFPTWQTWTPGEGQEKRTFLPFCSYPYLASAF